MGAPGSPKKKFETFGVPFKSNKSAQIDPKCPPKRAKNEPKRAQNDVEEHLYRGNADLSTSKKIHKQNQGLCWSKGPLGGAKSTPRGSKIKKKKQVT